MRAANLFLVASWTLAILYGWAAWTQPDSAPDVPLRFREMIAEAGIDYRNTSGEPEKRYVVSSLGSGAALFDYDEDGDLDVYFVNGSRVEVTEIVPAGPNRLYRNDGAFRFVDVTEAAGVGHTGWGLGCAAGDFDNDGLTDLYVTNLGPNVLYRNRGDGTFQDVTVAAGVGDGAFGTSTLFFDAEADGDLDLYVANYSEADIEKLPLPGSRPTCLWFGLPVFCGPSGLSASRDVYYRNEGNGRFTDASREARLDTPAAYGLGVVSGDYDGDGDVDLYVANDSVPNFLFVNRGDGTFAEDALFAGAAYSGDGLAQAGMGVDLADLDGDAWPDIVVTNFSHDTHTLYRNAGSGVFFDHTARVGLRAASWFYLGWATRIADFDNDGRADLFAAHGHVYPEADATRETISYGQRNQLYWNRDGLLTELDWAAGDGMLSEASSRGTAFGDLDDDGDLDIVVVNIDGPPSLLRNEIGGRAMRLRLVGRRSNRTAIGARILAHLDGRTGVFEVRPSGSYLSSNDPRLHVGLSDLESLARVEIRWPSGAVQVLENVREGLTTVVEPAEPAPEIPEPAR